MSRTYKDEIQQSYKRHPNAPYWKYGWWAWHTGGRRGKRKIRPLCNRTDRRRAKAALQAGLDDEGSLMREPLPRRNYIAWIYW